MTEAEAKKMLQRVRLELARGPEHPDGSSEHGYDFILPLDGDGHIPVDAWKLVREKCRVKRFWGDEPDQVGHILHKAHGLWAFHYDIRGDAGHDDRGFRLNQHRLLPGEYVSLTEQDGSLRTFVVRSIREVD